MVNRPNQLTFHDINKTKQGNFDSIRLQFELKVYQARLHYLELVKSHSEGSKPSNFDEAVLSLFHDLREQISREKR